MEDDLNDELRDGIESSARHLYGLIHARFILTSRGLSKMVDKLRKADFGRCPRVLCYGQALLPVGLSDIPYQKAVKLYCPRCEDIYSPKSSRHGAIEFVGSCYDMLTWQRRLLRLDVPAYAVHGLSESVRKRFDGELCGCCYIWPAAMLLTG